MRIVLHLLLVVVLAALAAGPGAGRAHAVAPVLHAASANGQVVAGAECGDCAADHAAAAVGQCVSVCPASATAVAVEQQFVLASEPAPRFSPGEEHSVGRSLTPDPSPPRTLPS